jgi:hypothetical protein
MLHAVVAVAIVGVACSDDTTGPVTSWTASLSGAREVPAVTSGAAGTATVGVSGLSVTYTLTITTLPTSAITAAHIHASANAGATATVRLDLCGTGATGVPACPTTAGGSVTRTVAFASGTTAMPGTPALTYDAFVSAIRNYNAYVNVHTTTNTGGEIRGQLQPVVP